MGALKRALRTAIRTEIISTDMRAIRVMYLLTKVPDSVVNNFHRNLESVISSIHANEWEN